jgi:hypothetical protein
MFVGNEVLRTYAVWTPSTFRSRCKWCESALGSIHADLSPRFSALLNPLDPWQT